MNKASDKMAIFGLGLSIGTVFVATVDYYKAEKEQKYYQNTIDISGRI